MQASLDRYLKNKGCKVSIIRGRQFATSNKILEGKAIPLRHEGNNNTTKCNRCTYLGRRRNAVERRLAWTIYSRSPSEHNLVLGDPTFWFKRKTRKPGIARWTPQVCKRWKWPHVRHSNPTKTRKSPKKLATWGEKRPVSILEEFITRRPSGFKESGPLYLAINYKPKSNI